MKLRLSKKRRNSRRAIPEGIRITKVGLWFVLITLVVAIAATNSGNNALYVVWAVMLGILVVSGVISRGNVTKLDVGLLPPTEVFARRPFRLGFSLKNRSRWVPRWFLLFAISPEGQPWLLPYLPRRGTGRGELELFLPRRGQHTISAVHVSSLFPFGLFRKGARYRVSLEMLVFPHLFSATSADLSRDGDSGSESRRRAGWGHGLHSLRRFRAGDDPRGIHWKQTARTGKMIYMEREAEESQRLAILFDNGVGELSDEKDADRFEDLVSEAATLAVDYLERGYEVELVTRSKVLPFAGGSRQRGRVLEELALVEPVARGRGPILASDPRTPAIRLAFSPDGGTRSQLLSGGPEPPAGGDPVTPSGRGSLEAAS